MAKYMFLHHTCLHINQLNMLQEAFSSDNS